MKKKYLFYFLVGIIVVLIFIVSAINLYLPYVLSDFINIFFSSDRNNSFNLILIYCGLAVFLFLLSVVLKYTVETFSWNYINFLRAQTIEKIVNCNRDFFKKFTTGDLMEYYEVDINKIYSFLSISLPKLMMNLLVVCTILIVFLKTSILLFTTFFLLVLLNMFLTKKFIRKNQNVIMEESNFHEKMSGISGEWLDMKSSISILGGTSNIMKQFKKMQSQGLSLNVNSNKFYYLLWCITLIINVIADIFILIVSCMLFLNNAINIGTVYLYYSYGKKIQSPLESLQQQFQACVRGWNSLKRIKKVLNYKSEIDDGNIPLDSNIESIKINNLSYSYDENIYTLKNISADFVAGGVYAIYGNSGDGKSTLSKILSRVMSYEDGTILINGIDLNQIKPKDYFKQTSYISNDAFVIKDNLLNNIKLYHNNVNEKMIDMTLKENGIYELLNINLNEDYPLRTLLDPNTLSLGQKQIISLTRLFFVNKSFIVIDEGMADIDESTAKSLLRKLINANSKAIILVISHNIDKFDFFDTKFQMKMGVLCNE